MKKVISIILFILLCSGLQQIRIFNKGNYELSKWLISVSQSFCLLFLFWYDTIKLKAAII